jgi:lipopolysaccharide transport system ATP-binding protein
MSYIAIQAENVTKQYVIRHQQSSNYTALRDVLVDKVKSAARGKFSSGTKETFLALDDVSFSIQAGDRVGIIGRNGAGKSTLLKVLSRIVAPTKGRITLDGRVASLLEVGTGFHPELSGRENVYLNGAILGMGKSEIDRKFDEIVAFAEVERFLDTPVKRYSSGMYVRLAFAVAAHLEPEILIVDEVLAVGDASFQKKCLGRMREVSGEGRTVLFVSHNMEAVQKLCNKGLLLHKGKLVNEGSMDGVIKAYLEQNASSQSVFEIERSGDAVQALGFAERVTIRTIDEKITSEVPVASPFLVDIEFQINRDMDHFIAGIGIVTMMELPFRTVWSKATAIKPGKYRIRFHFDDVHLAPGMYKLVVGLSNNESTFHFVDNTVYVDISDAAGTKLDERIINLRSGLIFNQVKSELISL